MIDAHVASGADVTIAYIEREIPTAIMNENIENQDLYYTLDMENGRVKKMNINSKETGVQNFSMNIYVIDRELLIDQIASAYAKGYVSFGGTF